MFPPKPKFCCPQVRAVDVANNIFSHDDVLDLFTSTANGTRHHNEYIVKMKITGLDGHTSQYSWLYDPAEFISFNPVSSQNNARAATPITGLMNLENSQPPHDDTSTHTPNDYSAHEVQDFQRAMDQVNQMGKRRLEAARHPQASSQHFDSLMREPAEFNDRRWLSAPVGGLDWIQIPTSTRATHRCMTHDLVFEIEVFLAIYKDTAADSMLDSSQIRRHGSRSPSREPTPVEPSDNVTPVSSSLSMMRRSMRRVGQQAGIKTASGIPKPQAGRARKAKAQPSIPDLVPQASSDH